MWEKLANKIETTRAQLEAKGYKAVPAGGTFKRLDLIQVDEQVFTEVQASALGVKDIAVPPGVTVYRKP